MRKLKKLDEFYSYATPEGAEGEQGTMYRDCFPGADED